MERTIAGLRRDIGLDREDYAIAVGVKKSSLGRYEQFKQVPPVDQALKIAHYHDLTVEDIKWVK